MWRNPSLQVHCQFNAFHFGRKRLSLNVVCVWQFSPLLLIALSNVKHLLAVIFPLSVFPYSSVCCSDMLPTSCNHYCTQEEKEGAKGRGFKVCFCPIHFDSVWRPKQSFTEAHPFLSHSSPQNWEMNSNSMSWCRLAKPHLSYLFWLWSLPPCCPGLYCCVNTLEPYFNANVNPETSPYFAKISLETIVGNRIVW